MFAPKIYRTVSRMLQRELKKSAQLKSACEACYSTPSNHNVNDQSAKLFPTDKFAQVVSNAEKIVGYPTSFMSLRCLLSDEMNTVAMYIRKLVGTKHPLLKIARGLVFNGRYGMQTRGLIVLLLAKAASEWRDDTLNTEIVSGIHNKQRQLAEIIETIHLADLIHKGIVNLRDLESENGQSVQDMEFGNKITVLTGDFLLANACTNLAKLENPKVVETVSDSISQMMESNFVFLADEPLTVDQWEEFTYLSRGALLANCCACALRLAETNNELQRHAYDYGKYLSFTHQIREDLRPFVEPGWSEPLNRRSLPVIHYLLHNDASGQSDKQLLSCVRASDSVEYARASCAAYGDRALEALSHFSSSSSRTALEDIVHALTLFPS